MAPTSSPGRLICLAKESLIQQEDVQTDYESDHHRGDGRGGAAVDQSPHHLSIAAVDQQRDQGEGDAEGEHDLAYDQGAAWVEPDSQDDEGRKHGYKAPQPQRDAPVYEPLHDDLAAQLMEGFIDIAHAGEAVGVEEGGGHDEHAGVYGPGYGHGDNHVHELEAEDLLFLLIRAAHHPALRQGRVQIDDVWHHRRPENACGQEHALGAGELRREEAGQYPIPLGLRVEHLESEGDDNYPNEGGDRRLQRPEAPPLKLEDPEGAHGSHETRREERYAEQEVEGERRPDELREVRGHRDDLSLHPEP